MTNSQMSARGSRKKHKTAGLLPALSKWQLARRSYLWQVPVIQGHMGLNASCQQVIDEAPIEVQAPLVDVPIPLRVDARPCDGHAEALDAQGVHELDVAHVPVVKVIRYRPCNKPGAQQSHRLLVLALAFPTPDLHVLCGLGALDACP